MTATRRLALLLLLVFSIIAIGFATDAPFDIVITNGHIIDGTGSPWYSGDVGIRDGRIAAIGDLDRAPRAKRPSMPMAWWSRPASSTCSASRSSRSWSIRGCLRRSTRASPPRSPAKAVRSRRSTTRIIAADRAGYEHYKITPDWTHLPPILRAPRKAGHGHQPRQLRRRDAGAAHGARRRRPCSPRPRELDRMKALVREAMRDGAVGVSTALQYAPAPYAKTEELIALAGEARKYGGIYATHMRNEGDSDHRRPSTRPFASAARRTSRSRSGT